MARQSKPEQKFNLLEALAVAVAIHREQGYVKVTDYGEGEPNSSRLKHTLAPENYGNYPTNPAKNITQADHKQAAEIVDYLRYTVPMLSLGTDKGLNGFDKTVCQLVSSPEVAWGELGILASLPKVYNDKLARELLQDRMADLARTSKPVGVQGQRGKFTLTCETVRYLGDYDSYIHTCSEGGENIVSFFNSEKLLDVGETKQIAGFVKSQGHSKFHNCTETHLNRVKVMK